MSIDVHFYVSEVRAAARKAHQADVDNVTHRDENGGIFYDRVPRNASLFLALAWIEEVNAEAESMLDNADSKMKKAAATAKKLEGDFSSEICYSFEWPPIKTIGPHSFSKKYPVLNHMLTNAKPAWLLRLELMKQLAEMVIEGEILAKED